MTSKDANKLRRLYKKFSDLPSTEELKFNPLKILGKVSNRNVFDISRKVTPPLSRDNSLETVSINDFVTKTIDRIFFVMPLKGPKSEMIDDKTKVNFHEYIEGMPIDNGMDGWEKNPTLYRLYRRPNAFDQYRRISVCFHNWWGSHPCAKLCCIHRNRIDEDYDNYNPIFIMVDTSQNMKTLEIQSPLIVRKSTHFQFKSILKNQTEKPPINVLYQNPITEYSVTSFRNLAE